MKHNLAQFIFAASLIVSCVFVRASEGVPSPPADLKITAVPDELRQALKLAPFYKKYVDAKGFPVLGSEKVQEAAMLEAARIVNKMLEGRDDVRAAIIKNKIRLAVMAKSELTTDVPEHSDLTPKAYWDARARGLGATHARPAVSCDEANLLHLDGDRYPNENILVHEFAHVIHEMGLNSIDPGFDKKVIEVYQNSTRKKALWKQTYATENHKEFWAEGVQSYFDTNDNNNHQHGDIDTRAKLKDYDPEFFALIDAAFKQNAWHYERPGKPNPPRKLVPESALEIVNRSGANAVIYRVDGTKEAAYTTLENGGTFAKSSSQGLRFRARIEGREHPIDFTVAGEKCEWVIK